jgi:hypothetical protein
MMLAIRNDGKRERECVAREESVPGNIVFRWYDRKQADEIYCTWTGEQLLQRLQAGQRKEDAQPPLGTPGVATTDSLEGLLREWQTRGLAERRIRDIPAERPSDQLLRYELICDACTSAEWRAKEAFFIRHLGGLRKETPGESVGPEEALELQAGMEASYASSRAGHFSWQTWPLLREGLERLEWERWTAAFRQSYEKDKTIRRAGVERSLRENYAALEELRRLLQEGERQGWALAVYEANDERLPFPPPEVLNGAIRETEAAVDTARHEAEQALARRQRVQRIVVPILLVVVFLFLGFFFTQSFLGAVLVAAVICALVGGVVWLILRRSS